MHTLTPFAGGFAAVASLLSGLFAFAAPHRGGVLLGHGLGVFFLLAV